MIRQLRHLCYVPLFLNSAFLTRASKNTDDHPGIPGTKLKYTDSFDTAPSLHWNIFEEIVSGNPCYAANIGSVSHTNTPRRGTTGGSLQVSSNAAGERASNHVLATRALTADRGVPGRFRYEVWFHVDNVTALAETQTGPELSIQNTFAVGLDEGDGYAPIWRTAIGALQYVGVEGRWNIWTKPDGGGVDTGMSIPDTAVWVPVDGPLIDEKGWWRLKYAVGFDRRKSKSKYYWYQLRSPARKKTKINLKGVRIVQEDRGWREGSLTATLEAQNLWTNCTLIKQNNAYYDNVKIFGPVVPEAPIVAFKQTFMKIGEKASLRIRGNDIGVYILVGHPDLTVKKKKNTLKFTPTAIGGVGIKYKACTNKSLLCSEEWWDIQVIE